MNYQYYNIKIKKMVETYRYLVDKSELAKADYEITDKNLIIRNVPLTGEIVQAYFDSATGKELYAYKPLEEIQKIKVDKVPITFLHPDRNGVKAVGEMDTEIAAEEVYGYMMKPSLDKKEGKIHSDKLYADLVYFRGNDMVDILEEKLEDGEGVDVSIGFKFVEDKTKGTFKDKAYDYIQRAIKLDHLATLVDSFKRVHEGRASFKAGFGIGADSKGKMADEKLIADHADLKNKYSNLESDMAAQKEAMDNLKTEKEAVDAKYAELKTASDVMKTELDAFKAKEKEATDSKRAALKEKMPAFASVFDTADKAAIDSAFDEMNKSNGKTLGDVEDGEGEGESNGSDSKKKLSSYDRIQKEFKRGE